MVASGGGTPDLTTAMTEIAISEILDSAAVMTVAKSGVDDLRAHGNALDQENHHLNDLGAHRRCQDRQLTDEGSDRRDGRADDGPSAW